MRSGTWIVSSVFCAGLALAAAAQTGSTLSGQWIVNGPPRDGKVELTLQASRGAGGHFSSSSMLPLEQLRGLTGAQMQSGGAPVRFEIVRDAGTLACEGYFKNGDGAGAFAFSPSAGFVSELQSLGHTGLSPEKVFAMAVHDVTRAYVRDLRALNVNASSDQLLAMRIHGVAIDYIKEMKSLGYGDLGPDKLIAMRIHGVSTEFARGLKALGYNASADQMVALRIHGAALDFVKQVRSLGYTPTIDQLVAMRIHRVTPEFIQNLESRGMKKLTIDQLVSLKIHGIDD